MSNTIRNIHLRLQMLVAVMAMSMGGAWGQAVMFQNVLTSSDIKANGTVGIYTFVNMAFDTSGKKTFTTADGTQYTDMADRIKTGGSGSTTNRCVSFTAPIDGTLYVYAVAGGDGTRRIIFSDGTNTQSFTTTATVTGYTYTVTKGNTYYVYGDSGINIYVIALGCNVGYLSDTAYEWNKWSEQGDYYEDWILSDGYLKLLANADKRISVKSSNLGFLHVAALLPTGIPDYGLALKVNKRGCINVSATPGGNNRSVYFKADGSEPVEKPIGDRDTGMKVVSFGYSGDGGTVYIYPNGSLNIYNISWTPLAVDRVDLHTQGNQRVNVGYKHNVSLDFPTAYFNDGTTGGIDLNTIAGGATSNNSDVVGITNATFCHYEAKKIGTATITHTLTAGKATHAKDGNIDCPLPVSESFDVEVVPIGVAFGNIGATEATVGKTVASPSVSATATFADNGTEALSSGFTYESLTPAVATVDPATGVITGVAEGTATIRVTAPVSAAHNGETYTLSNATATGLTSTFTVTVRKAPPVVTYSFKIGGSTTPAFTISEGIKESDFKGNDANAYVINTYEDGKSVHEARLYSSVPRYTSSNTSALEVKEVFVDNSNKVLMFVPYRKETPQTVTLTITLQEGYYDNGHYYPKTTINATVTIPAETPLTPVTEATEWVFKDTGNSGVWPSQIVSSTVRDNIKVHVKDNDKIIQVATEMNFLRGGGTDDVMNRGIEFKVKESGRIALEIGGNSTDRYWIAKSDNGRINQEKVYVSSNRTIQYIYYTLGEGSESSSIYIYPHDNLSIYSIKWTPYSDLPKTWKGTSRSVSWTATENLANTTYYEEFPESSAEFYQYNVKKATLDKAKPLQMPNKKTASGTYKWTKEHALGFKLESGYKGVAKVYFRSTSKNSMQLKQGNDESFESATTLVGEAAGAGDNESTPQTLMCTLTGGKTYWITAKDGSTAYFGGFDLILYRNERFAIKSGQSDSYTILPEHQGTDGMKLDKVFRQRLETSVEVENGSGVWFDSGSIPMNNVKLTYALASGGSDYASINTSTGEITPKKRGTFNVVITLAAGEYQKGGYTYVYPQQQVTVQVTIGGSEEVQILNYGNAQETIFLHTDEPNNDHAWQTLKVNGVDYDYSNSDITFTLSSKFYGESYTVTFDQTNHTFKFPATIPRNGDAEFTVTATYKKTGAFTNKTSYKLVCLTDIESYPLVTPDAWQMDLDYLSAPNELVRRYYISSDDLGEYNCYVPNFNSSYLDVNYEIYDSYKNAIYNGQYKGSDNKMHDRAANGTITYGSSNDADLVQVYAPDDNLIEKHNDFTITTNTNKCLVIDNIVTKTNVYDNELSYVFPTATPLPKGNTYTLTMEVFAYADGEFDLYADQDDPNVDYGQWWGGGRKKFTKGTNTVTWTFTTPTTHGNFTKLRILFGYYTGQTLIVNNISLSGGTSATDFSYDFSDGSMGNLERPHWHTFNMEIKECAEVSRGLLITNIETKANMWENQICYEFENPEKAKVTNTATVFSFDVFSQTAVEGKMQLYVPYDKVSATYTDGAETKTVNGIDPILYSGVIDLKAGWTSVSFTLPATLSKNITVKDSENNDIEVTGTSNCVNTIRICFGTMTAKELYIGNIKLVKVADQEVVLDDRNNSGWNRVQGHTFNVEKDKMAPHVKAGSKGVKDVLVTFVKKIGTERRVVRRERHVFYFIKAPKLTESSGEVTLTKNYTAADAPSNNLYYTIDMSIPSHKRTDDANVDISADLNTRLYTSTISTTSNLTYNGAQFIKVPIQCIGPDGQRWKRFTLVSNELDVAINDDEVTSVQKDDTFTPGIKGIQHITSNKSGTPLTTLHIMYGGGAGTDGEPNSQAWYKDPSRGFTLSDLTWGKGKTEGVPSLDGYKYYSSGSGDNANPCMEIGGRIAPYRQDEVPSDLGIRGTDGVTPENGGLFLNPVAGDFLRFEPEYDGVLSVWIRQNGASDNSTMTNGGLRRRPVYLMDENGYIMRRSTFKPTADSYYCVNGIFATINNRKSKFRYDFENTWNYGLEHWGSLSSDIRKTYRFYSQVYPWLVFTERMTTDNTSGIVGGKKTDIVDERNMAVSLGQSNLVSRYNYISSIIYGSRKLGSQKYQLTHTHNDAANGEWEHTVVYDNREGSNWLSDFANYGYELPNFYWVRYRMPLKAGKTYYMGGRATKNGVIAVKYEILECNYHPKNYRNSDNEYLYDTKTNDTGEENFTTSTTYTRDPGKVYKTYHGTQSECNALSDQYDLIKTYTIDENDNGAVTTGTMGSNGTSQQAPWLFNLNMYDNSEPYRTEAAIDNVASESILAANQVSNNPFVGNTMNVTVKRTFTKGKIHPIVLPFSVSESRMRQMFGDNVIVLYLDPDQSSSERFLPNTVHRKAIDGVKIKFTRHFYQMLYANVPAFIIPDKTVENPTFGRVTYEGNQIREYEIGGGFKVTGSYTCTSAADNGEMYYIANTTVDGKNVPTVYYAQDGQKMKGMRVWIKAPTAAGASLAPRLRNVGFTDFGDEELDDNYSASAIDDASADLSAIDHVADPNIYNLQGIAVGRIDRPSTALTGEAYGEAVTGAISQALKHLPTGIYIFQGRKLFAR